MGAENSQLSRARFSSLPEGYHARDWRPSAHCSRHEQTLEPDDECEWSTDTEEGKSSGNTMTTNIFTVTTQTTHSLLSLKLDCRERQLPDIVYHSLNSNCGSLTSLTLSNLPVGCRVCIYDMFRQLRLHSFAKLQTLDLTRTYMDECYIKLDEEMLCLPKHLEHLTFHGLGLVTIPPGVTELPHLQHLSLCNNILTSVDDLLASPNLHNLTVLDLSRNCLPCLPEPLHHLPKLTVFDVSHNCIKKTIPDDIKKCDQLVELYLEWNRVEAIPCDAILSLSKLTLLDLSHNKIKSISSCIFFHTSLILLNLAGNNNLILVDDSKQPRRPQSNLQELDVSLTGLTQIPNWFVHLNQLKVLKSTNNQLNSCGVVSSMLAHIQVADLRLNDIQSVRELFPPRNSANCPVNMARSVMLNLSGNPIHPDSVAAAPPWMNVVLDDNLPEDPALLSFNTKFIVGQRRTSFTNSIGCFSCVAT